MTSIRTKLAVWLVGAVLLVSAAAGGLLLLAVHHQVRADFDEALAGKARAMATMVRRDEHGQVEVDFADEMMGEFTSKKHPEYFEVWNSAGEVIERSPSLKGRDLPKDMKDIQAVELPDGRVGRGVWARFVPEPSDEEDARIVGLMREPVMLAVARGTEPIEHMLEVVGWGLAMAAGVMAAGVGMAVWLLVSRGLRPLRGVANQAERIDATRLSERFETEVPAELASIVGRLNELLARLEGAFARERRFTSAAAHELRTPIAELRAMAEVAIRWPEESTGQGMREVLAVACGMESLAGALLALSRCESGQEQARREAVDLSEAVARAWEMSGRKRASERGVRFHLEREGEVMVVADPTMVEAIARNLLDNAVEYAPADSEVICCVGSGRMVVTNLQEGLTPGDMSSLFEPFWRRDAARTGGGHAGLGLSLVKAYAAAMNARVRAELTADGAFRMEVVFGQSKFQLPAVMIASSLDHTLPEEVATQVATRP